VFAPGWVYCCDGRHPLRHARADFTRLWLYPSRPRVGEGRDLRTPRLSAKLPMRLNKYLSESGFCSRREADDLIAQGRVTLNGEGAATAAKWLEGMSVRVDDEEAKLRAAISNKRKHVYIALNTPVGITCTTDQSV